ncbi:MAG: hypothetical protein OXI35_04265 [Gemmatimonadota bacterium]|nr:hypothetical protein [Gemmatimonadota bacterium]
MGQTTRNVLVRGKPKGLTASEWIRLMVEVLVRWPSESAARSQLKDLVENRYRHEGFDPKAGPYKVHFRVREDHWLALETMAQAAGRSRMVPPTPDLHGVAVQGRVVCRIPERGEGKRAMKCSRFFGAVGFIGLAHSVGRLGIDSSP